MSLNLVLAACFLVCVQPIFSNSVSFIKKCKIDDGKCIKASAQAAIPIFAVGIKELGVASIDPFNMKSIDGSSPNLKLHLNDIVATGLSKCIAKKMQFSEDHAKLHVKLLCTVDAKGLYDLDGNILVLKISGKGDAHVVLRKVLITVEANIKEVTGSDEQTHLKIGKWKHSYELKDKATVELDNLFNGNDALGRAARDLITNNPNEIVAEVGPPIITAACGEIIKNINIFFAKVPKSDLVE